MTRIFALTWIEAVLLLVGLGALAAEIVALATGTRLISPTMRDDGTRWMLWPALWGVLGGHFYGPAIPRGAPWVPLILAGLGALILARDLFLRERLPVESLFAVLLAGTIAGAVLWTQGGAA